MKYYKKLKNIKGLTLVELLLALGLVGMVVTVLFGFFMVGMRAYGKGNIQTDLQYEVRRATNEIADRLRHAKSINTSESNIDIDIVNYIDSRYAGTMDYSKTGSILTVTIEATDGKSSYDLTTEILLDNISINDTSGDFSGTNIISYEFPSTNNFDISYEVFKGSDATLKNINPPSGTILSTAFDSSIYNYAVVLPKSSMGTYTVSAESNDPKADISPNVLSTEVPGTITIKVTSEDGKYTKTYSIEFRVADVSNPITSLVFNDPSIDVLKNDLLDLNTKITYTTLGSTDYEFNILTEGSNATLSGSHNDFLTTGNAEQIVIEVKSTDGSGFSDLLNVNVVNNLN